MAVKAVANRKIAIANEGVTRPTKTPSMTIMAVKGGTAIPKRRVPSREMAVFLSRMRQSARADFLKRVAKMIRSSDAEGGRFSSPKVFIHLPKSHLHWVAALDFSKRKPNHQRMASVMTMGSMAIRMRRRGTRDYDFGSCLMKVSIASNISSDL